MRSSLERHGCLYSRGSCWRDYDSLRISAANDRSGPPTPSSLLEPRTVIGAPGFDELQRVRNTKPAPVAGFGEVYRSGVRIGECERGSFGGR